MGLKSGTKSGKGVKQGTTKLGVGKSIPPSPSKQSDSDDESDIDTSVMRPSIEISVSTVPQLVRAYQAATEELKSILSKECDIIYECRVCRNLFRSLANMIAHKRVYCKTAYSYTKHSLNRNHVVEDYTVLIQPEPAPSNLQENWTTSDKVPDCTDKNDAKHQIVATTSRISSFTNVKKGLREIVDRLARNTTDNRTSKETKYASSTKLYDNTNVLAKTDKIEHSFQLEDIETSKVGKFQTKLVSAVGAEKDDLMKAQVSELQHMASQNEALLGPDGKMVTLSKHSSLSFMKSSLGKISEASVEAHEHKSTKDEHVCPDCNVRFSTRKTLNHHMKSLHVTFRLCYPCPCCKSTFVNPWSVYRHLYKVHRKTAAQVRRLRPQIQKKAFKKEIHNETPVPESSSKNEALKELQRLDQENQAWMDNFEDDLELQRCGGCGRRFERRAALNSHSQICQKRIAARNNVKVSRHLSTTTSPNKTTKISPIDERSLATESNKKDNIINKSIDTVHVLNALVTSRSHHVASWAEQPKKEVPEKKIEIQIRKDYCKMSSASSVVALSNDTQSETDSRPPSRIVEDEYSYDGDVRDWESVMEIGEVNKEESESEYPLFRDAQSSSLTNEDDKDEEEVIVCTNSPEDIRESAADFNSSIQNNVLNRSNPKSGKFGTCRRPENILKRKVSDEGTHLSKSVDIELNKRKRQSSENENSNILEDLNKNMSSKNKKLEQFHPVMEARMKKLINLRRLQCLPCQKKFIKLTNLRRHVAVHIGWCRYKCMLCAFKCFSKYDCVDHVCKIHLKGTQRSKASTMVEYIEEQESEVTTGSEQLQDLNDISDFVGICEEAPEPLSMEINSLNLEDIKNIVGVTCYPDDSNKAEICSNISGVNIVNSLSPVKHLEDNDTSLESNSEEHKGSIEAENVQSVPISELKREILEDKKCVNYPEIISCSEASEEEQKCEDQANKNIVNDCDEALEKKEILSPENENKPSEEEESRPGEELDVEPTSVKSEQNVISAVSDGCKSILAHKLDDKVNISSDESSKDSFDMPNDNKIIGPASPCFMYEQRNDSSNEMIEEESDELTTENEDVNNEKSASAGCHVKLEASEMECIHDTISIKEESVELEPSYATGIVEENHIINNDVDDHDYAVNNECEGEMTSENTNSSDCPTYHEEDPNALRKMVMEVIFGSAGASDSLPDPNQNLISVSMNGNVSDEDSSEGRNSRASSISDSEIILVKHVTATSKVSKQNTEVDCGHGTEGEKRERPVRNRVKVEKEDFIYDFTDSFLKKEEIPKGGVHIGSTSGSKKKPGDSGKDSVKYDFTSDHNKSASKAVPKLMLVRTDGNETSGNKRTNGPIKGSWSSVYAPTTDCASNKHCLEPNQQMCSSSRKLPRTYDVKQ